MLRVANESPSADACPAIVTRSRPHDSPSCCSTWRPVAHVDMLRTWGFDLRRTAALTHVHVGFCPRRKLGFRLHPMCYGGLITPVQKMWHRGLVGTRGHELSHTLLIIPGCHGPEGPASIGQYCTCLKSWCMFPLPHRSPSMKCEKWHKAHRPDSKPCQTDEGHSHITSRSHCKC